MNSAAQKESYDYLGNDQEGISSDLRGQEVTLISMLLKKKDTNMYAFSKRKRLLKVKFIFKHKSFFLDYKAHVLDT